MGLGDRVNTHKESKFIYITDTSFINSTAKFGHFVDIIDDAVNPYHISSLNKQLDKAEIKNICHGIDYKFLMNILEYQNTNG